MKVLVATEKPFAAAAVNGIKAEIEAAGNEVVLLEKYIEKAQLLDAVKDADALIIRSDKVDVVITSTSANYNLQLLGSVEHFSVDLIRTDNECVGILYGVEQLSLLCIFLEQHEFIARCLYFFANALNSSTCKWFFCCY